MTDGTWPKPQTMDTAPQDCDILVRNKHGSFSVVYFMYNEPEGPVWFDGDICTPNASLELWWPLPKD